MRSNCAMSCGTCDKIANKAVTKTGTRTRTDEEVLAATAKFGERQLAEGGDAVETLALIEDSVTYMTSDQVMSLPATIRENCRNKNDLCSFWAYVGMKNNFRMALLGRKRLLGVLLANTTFYALQVNVKPINRS